MNISNNNISKKQVSINMAANIVSYSANIIISFILTPFLINTLGKETYSFYPIANTIVSYMSVLMNALNSIASRFVTVSLVQNKKDDAYRYFSSTLASNLIISAILFAPMVLIVTFLERFMEVPINSLAAIKGLFILIFSATLVNISASVFGIATFAKNRIDLRSFRELVTSVLRLVLFFVFYKILPPSILYVGVITLIIAIINIIFQIAYTRMLLPEMAIKKEYISKSHIKELIGSSCWNAINTFGNTLLAGMSMILSNIFYGAKASGSYAIVNTVPQFICGVIVMLCGIFYPVITYKYAQYDTEGLVKEIKRAQTIIGLLGCVVIAVFSALASEFFSLWTPSENADFLSLISFVTIIPHFFISCMWILTNVNVVMNKVKIPAIFTLISGIVNVALAYVVYIIWSPGLVSLPIISCMLQLIWVGILIPQYVCKNLKVKWSTFYPPLMKALTCSGITFLIILTVKQYFELTSWVKLFVFSGLCGMFSLILFGIVMIDFRNIKRILFNILKIK